MAVKSYNPTTPSLRGLLTVKDKLLSKACPEKSLLTVLNKSGGRNNQGRITSRFRGGGHKRKYRVIDFHRKLQLPGTVKRLEYDPNRTCNLALVTYINGVKSYIIAPNGIKIGSKILSSEIADIQIGNCLPLEKIPVGTNLHNLELFPGSGGKIARSAGSSVQLVGFEGDHAQIKMPSGEIRMLPKRCSATIGQVGNLEHENRVVGKAGRNRWLGFRPHNRGVSMNPVDHPMGGGEGKSSGGRHPVSPWGQKSKGKKTRKNKRTQRFIIRSRRGR